MAVQEDVFVPMAVHNSGKGFCVCVCFARFLSCSVDAGGLFAVVDSMRFC